MKEIEQMTRQLVQGMKGIQQSLKYSLEIHPDHRLSVDEFREKVFTQAWEERFGILKLRVRGLLNDPQYNWAFKLDPEGKVISDAVETPAVGGGAAPRNHETRRTLELGLASTASEQAWEECWNKLKNLAEDRAELRNVLVGSYKTCNITEIRGRIQRKLVELVKEEQKERAYTSFSASWPRKESSVRLLKRFIPWMR